MYKFTRFGLLRFGLVLVGSDWPPGSVHRLEKQMKIQFGEDDDGWSVFFLFVFVKKNLFFFFVVVFVTLF